MNRSTLFALSFGLCFVAIPTARADDKEDMKEGLRELQLFVGQWKGTGSPIGRSGPTLKGAWTEKIEWGWKFTKKEAYLIAAFKDAKNFKSAELRFLPDDEIYQLTVVDKADKKLVFEGELANNYLTLTRKDPKTKDVQEVRMNSAADGDRFVYRYSEKAAGKTRFIPRYIVGVTREGISLGGLTKTKDRECIISGGLGTITVSFKGMTFWVCCSGCRDAFNEDPEKFVKAFLKNKK